MSGETKYQRVATMFTRISPKYDFMNTVMTAGTHKRWRHLAAEVAVKGLQPGLALDVGTGTGDFVFELARRPEVNGVVGVDFVPEMLTLARGKEQARHVKQTVVWLQGDAQELPFPDNTFMCATIGFVMRNVTDTRRAVGEMARVVRPGGRVVILELTLPEKGHSLAAFLAKGFARIAPVLGQVLAGDRDAYTYLPRSVQSFLTANSLSALMEDVGLRNVHYRLVGFGLVALHIGEVA